MNDASFLGRLKGFGRVVSNASDKAYPVQASELWFVLSFDDGGEAFLHAADGQGKVIYPDYRLYDGPEFLMLRAMEQVRKSDMFDLSWAGSEQRLSLSRHPHLVYPLLGCKHIKGPAGETVQVSNEKAITAHINLSSKDVDGVIHPVIILSGESKSLGSPRFITDSFALAEGQLATVQAIGENYRYLDSFLDPFHESLLCQYLSVLFSHILHVKVDIPGTVIQVSDDPVKTQPVLIIEKVDDDLALYLRVSQEVPGLDSRFMEDFGITCYASEASPGRISLRSISQQSVQALGDSLLKQIGTYSPSKTAAKSIFRDGSTFIVPKETAEQFLFSGLPSIARLFKILGADKLKGYKVRPVQPKLNLKLGSGIDFLEGSASVEVGGEVLSLAAFLQQYKSQKYIQLSDGDKAIIDEDYIKRLERIFSKAGRSGTVKVSFFDLPEVATMLDEVPQTGAFARNRKFYEGFNALKDKQLRTKGLKAVLRPYQKEGIKWMQYLFDNDMGGCLADDMGLGKTVQAIALMCRVCPGAKFPSMVVMPKSLLFNWSAELSRFAPDLSVGVYYGSSRSWDSVKDKKVILTTYGMVRSDVEVLSKEEFMMLVLDESQNIKNTGAQMTKAVLMLRSRHRFALSGTPVENNLTELYSLFRFLNPAMFGPEQGFSEKYLLPIQKESDQETLRELRRKIKPFILRRTKTEVLDDLPDRVDQRIFVQMEPSHAAFYERRRRYFQDTVREGIAANGVAKSQFVILQALSELRRIASVPESMSDSRVLSSKIPVLMESLEEAVANSHKCVVFFNFIAGIELVGERLEAAGIGYATMTGSTVDRKVVIDRFQSDPSCQVLLMTLKTGGVGLNLTAADTVFIFEPWWNRAEEEQAIGRLHRIGQSSKVMTFSIITEGTIEEKICKLQEIKTVLVDSLIASDGALNKQLSEEDIEFILR